MKIRGLWGAAVACVSWLAVSSAALADTADVDPTFGTDGLAIADGGSTPDQTQGVIVGDDFIYVLANGHSIRRFTPDGEPDNEFGDGGILTFAPIDFIVTAVGEDRAGGLFLGGKKLSNVAVTHIDFEGNIDEDFGDGGYAIINTPGLGEVRYIRFYNLKVWVLGSTHTSGGDFRDAFVAKLSQAGDPDFGWGTNGIALVNFGTPCDEAQFFSQEPAGSVLIGGDTSYAGCEQEGIAKDIAIARLDAIGQFAPSLGNTGIDVLDLGGDDTLSVVVAQTTAAQKIAFAALSTSTTTGITRQVIGRLTPKGTLDVTFNRTGKVSETVPAIEGFAFNGTAGVQSLGQIVYAGDIDGDIGILRVEGSPQLSIDDVGAGNGGGGTGGEPTHLSGGGGGSFGWLGLAVLGLGAALRRRFQAPA